MKKFIAILFCASFALALAAQQRTGNINGTVTDDQGNPLPGVSLTLTGATIGSIPTVTSAEGKFRFLSLFPGSDYVIKAELSGFKTKTETGIIVNIGRNSDIVISMEQGGLEEQITVIAQTPIVDAKKTQITHTVSYEMLQSLPSARDPWVVLQMTPAVQMDRENIGGVESGQQSGFQAKGSTNNEWTVDGLQVTDKSSVSSATYFDFDSFEELNISTGTLDVEHRDPSVVINIVTRRGTNKTSIGGRFFWTDSKFQSVVPQSRLDEFGVSGYNRVNDIKDFGFNAGGPFVKDKAWWWMSYGIQQVKTFNTVNVADDTYLNNYNAKLNFQLIPQNRFEVLFMLGDKTKFGRSSSEFHPPGLRQGSKQHFGNPTIKLQDEQMFGDSLFLSVRVGKVAGGFGLIPEEDLKLTKPQWYDVEKNLYYNSYYWFYSDRPHQYGVVQAQYFNDNLIFGTAHEVKVGFEVNNNGATTVSGYPGNFTLNTNYYDPRVDYSGPAGVPDGVLDDFDINRDLALIYVNRWTIQNASYTKRIAGYFSDTISKGRFNFVVSFRFDRATPGIKALESRGLWSASDPVPTYQYANYAALDAAQFSAEAITGINSVLEPRGRDALKVGKSYTLFSPRGGLTYDIFGDGKTVLKVSYALYPGGYPGTAYWAPYGIGGWMGFWWDDINGNHQASPNELFWTDTTAGFEPLYRPFSDTGVFQGNEVDEYNSYWGGFTWGSSALTKPTSYIDLANWKTDLTHEVNVSIEREIAPNFGASVSGYWKRMGRYSWTRHYYPSDPANTPNDAPVYTTDNGANHIENQNDYYIAGYVPDTLWLPGPDGRQGTIGGINYDADNIAVDPGAAAGLPWYALIGPSTNANTRSTPYHIQTMMPANRYNTYYGFDLILTKRLANKWMFNGSFTYQMQKQHLGDGWLDPTGNWSYDNQIFGFTQGGTSGKINQVFFSRWMVKLMGLYQLPYDINLSGTVSAHEGTFNTNSFSISNYTSTNPQYNSNDRSDTFLTHTYNNSDRLPNVYVVNFKLEKVLRLGTGGRMYLSVDMFNAFNSQTPLRRYNRALGTFRQSGAIGSEMPFSYANPSGTQGKYNELMNPLVFRLGVRFEI
jgi:hypothetical protein